MSMTTERERDSAVRSYQEAHDKVKTRNSGGDEWDPFNLAKPKRMRGKRVR